MHAFALPGAALRCAGQDTSRQPGYQQGGDPREMECRQHQVPETSQSLTSRREKEGCPFQAGVPRPMQESSTRPSTAVVVTATAARTGGMCSAARETQGNRRVPTALTSEGAARPWEAHVGGQAVKTPLGATFLEVVLKLREGLGWKSSDQSRMKVGPKDIAGLLTMGGRG